MKGSVEWVEGKVMRGITESGKVTEFYSDTAANPMEIVQQAHAACSMIDLFNGLKHRMDDVKSMRIDINTDRKPESPRVFTDINMKYIIEGDIPEKLVRRIIQASHDKYCSVGKMLTKSGAVLTWSLEIQP
jgi:putative redox protein|tara:strand:- start:379 stop:771 length:393 start_codon:yes stop_codon:yes gene_type:complete